MHLIYIWIPTGSIWPNNAMGCFLGSFNMRVDPSKYFVVFSDWEIKIHYETVRLSKISRYKQNPSGKIYSVTALNCIYCCWGVVIRLFFIPFIFHSSVKPCFVNPHK
ncbi:uncharacterized protein NEPG_02382 [Nematocida parisii ERTm1]|uniref:Uncharacterized protein n=1 Tax=Nematocida parisii (strain ERTm3) TaxID=935791 RepID=I3EHT4_NEMP3|nr:uncharacterized protein NEPG_02382 [Nematocida parisii ERTm1]EIJ88781.1 hypothetical protein NEQG_00600 [Nematocida parisii ERTm3]EIJ92690.1 hypothetical protein NEPG_02382 [Nematocida parisii ERTm1]|eukprot:XP_013060209.1 hypothetical protein NEPG_02382 [Nematocida parisii ERTm1]